MSFMDYGQMQGFAPQVDINQPIPAGGGGGVWQQYPYGGQTAIPWQWEFENRLRTGQLGDLGQTQPYFPPTGGTPPPGTGTTTDILTLPEHGGIMGGVDRPGQAMPMEPGVWGGWGRRGYPGDWGRRGYPGDWGRRGYPGDWGRRQMPRRPDDWFPGRIPKQPGQPAPATPITKTRQLAPGSTGWETVVTGGPTTTPGVPSPGGYDKLPVQPQDNADVYRRAADAARQMGSESGGWAGHVTHGGMGGQVGRIGGPINRDRRYYM